jgi:hypothetical protein
MKGKKKNYDQFFLKKKLDWMIKLKNKTKQKLTRMNDTLNISKNKF